MRTTMYEIKIHCMKLTADETLHLKISELADTTAETIQK